MSEQKQSLFELLHTKNVNEHVEKKGQLKYLSWVYAHAEIKKVDENATTEVHEFPYIVGGQVVEGVTVPYLLTEQGAMVKVSVTINGKTETEWLPVMDHKNQTMMQPKTTDINKAHKRCFAKAVALHGLGLYIYAGDDLPEAPPAEKKATVEDIKTLGRLATTLSGYVGKTPEQVSADYGLSRDMLLDKAREVKKELQKAISDVEERDPLPEEFEHYS